MKIPDDVRAKLAQCEAVLDIKRRKQMAIDKDERERQDAVEELRNRRYDELHDYAEFIFEWRDAFGRRKASDRIWRAIEHGRLTIFGARFFNGRPAPANDRTVWARLVLERVSDPSMAPVQIRYEELWKGQEARHECFFAAYQMVRGVHPDFLEKAYLHFKSADAWKFVADELDRVLRGLKGP